jgi:hypothetical protein
MTRKVLRELTIMRKLTEMQSNYTTQILDIILPLGVNTVNSQYGVETEESENKSQPANLDKLTHIFIVMEKCDMNVSKMMSIG